MPVHATEHNQELFIPNCYNSVPEMYCQLQFLNRAGFVAIRGSYLVRDVLMLGYNGFIPGL